MTYGVEQELQDATNRILESDSRKKLIVAGPGAGKTYIFGALLNQSAGQPDERLVLTFINALKEDIDRSLGHLAHVSTLHSYCLALLYRHADLRPGLAADFICYPELASLIKQDWVWLRGSDPPSFVKEMRHLQCLDDHAEFYMDRGDYYGAVDFDDTVYRAYRGLSDNPAFIPPYELVLVDEFQDFNAMEGGIIRLLADRSPMVIAGDDDQALYSQIRQANWDHIRAHHYGDEYEVFELPFCMRCTEVIVGAVNDVITQARATANLDGRIDKPYRFYEPHKGEDSRQYPTIDLVRTSTQRRSGAANYFGRYIEQKILEIPQADIDRANADHEPVALVIGPKPYRPMVLQHLIDAGLCTAEDDTAQSERERGLELLQQNPNSNLGWRVILSCGDLAIAAERVCAAAKHDLPLVDVIPEDERGVVLAEAHALAGRQAVPEEAHAAPNDGLNVQVTTFEGSKGLSAQHVFLIGLQEGDIPRNALQIQDIEICRFVVALTRTKKKCSVLLTHRFGADIKNPSLFLNWINQQRYTPIEVNAAYWQERNKSISQ